MGEGPHRPLCRARAGQQLDVTLERDHGRAHAARTRRAQLARRRDGHLRAGKARTLHARPVTAAGRYSLPLARARLDLLPLWEKVAAEGCRMRGLSRAVLAEATPHPTEFDGLSELPSP